MPGQAVFGRDMLLNLALVLDWWVVTAAKKQQVDIDNVQEKASRVTHGYIIGYWFYVEITGIYQKLDYTKQVMYETTEVFTNGIFQVQQVQVKEWINIIRLKPYLNE